METIDFKVKQHFDIYLDFAHVASTGIDPGCARCDSESIKDENGTRHYPIAWKDLNGLTKWLCNNCTVEVLGRIARLGESE